MSLTRTTWWAALAATALVAGCSDTGETTDTSTPPATAPAAGPVAPGPAPETPPAPKSGGGMSAELAPAPAPAAVPDAPDAGKDDAGKAGDASAPKIDAPKIEPPKVEAPKSEPEKGDSSKADASKSAAAAVQLTDEEIANIKKLPADEQVAALKQAVCPVSGEHLGMAKPVKITAEGKTFYLCCGSCKDDVAKDPKAVVAKLAGK